MAVKRNKRYLYQLRKPVEVVYRWQIVDRDFRRPITYFDGNYYFPVNDEKSTCFLTEDEAIEALSRIKPPCPSNPFIILKKKL